MELAGVPKDAVEIVYRDRQLTLRGSKRPVPFDALGQLKGELLRDETFTGAFEKSIPLPTEVDGRSHLCPVPGRDAHGTAAEA